MTHRRYETGILFAEREENGARWRLQIRHCGPRQSGKYAVVAKNRSGVASRQWNLQLCASTQLTQPKSQSQYEDALDAKLSAINVKQAVPNHTNQKIDQVRKYWTLLAYFVD